jgi:plastocyanin
VRLTAVALVALVLSGPAAATLPPLTRVQVTAKEFYFSLSRQTVESGPAIIELVNFGEDPHDLRLQRVGGAHIAGTPQVQPGAFYDLKVTLLPGKYNLWCSIANHRALGMQATLTVRKR